MQVKKQQLELDMEQETGSKFGQENVKAAYCHSAYLTCMQSASCEMPAGWRTAGIKIAMRNNNKLRYADNSTLMAESEEELKSLLVKVKQESEKAGLKLNIQKNESFFDSFSSVQFHQFSSVAQSCPTLCNPIDNSTPSLPVHHQLPEFTQTHVYWVGDAIQPSHPLLPSSPPAFNLSQHQGLFLWVSSFHQVKKNIGVSASASFIFHCIFRTDFL